MNKTVQFALLLSALLCSAKGMAREYIGELPDFNPNALSRDENIWYLALEVNGHRSKQSYPMKRIGDDFLVEAEILRTNHILLDSKQHGEINIGTLAEVRAHYNSSQQILELSVPESWLPLQRYDANSMREDYAVAHRDKGLLVNYDLYGYRPSIGYGYASGYVSTAIFSDWFHLENAGTWFQPFGADSGYYSRLNTTLTIDDQTHLLTFQAGDIITRSVADENSVQLGGLKLSRNFAMDRQLVTYPTMKIDGSATLPSTLDVFVNNAQVANAKVNSGPFVVSNIPFINGDGTAQVVTTDSNGRQVTSTVSFYNSGRLLKSGLSDFDLNLGLLRYRETRNSRYQNLATSLSYRYGLTDYITGAIHGEAASQLQVAGSAVDLKLATFGVLSGSLYHSQADKEAGNRYSVGYSYANRFGALNVSHQQSDTGYHSLADYKSLYRQSNRTDQISLNGNFGRFSLGTGFFRVKSQNDVSRVVNLSVSASAPFGGNLMLSLSRELERAGTSAYLSWSMQLGSDYSLGVNSNRSRYQNTQGVTLSKNISDETGLGGTVSVQHQSSKASAYRGGGNNDTYDGQLRWKHQYGELSGGVWHSQPHQQDYWLETSGALVVMNNNLFATREVSDAFLMVDTNGVADVPYSLEGRDIGKTNARGIGFIPDATSYNSNRVLINPLDLAANVNAGSLEQITSVKRGGGRVVHFNLTQEQNAFLTLLDSHGQPLPAGLLVSGLPNGATTVTGYDGVVYLPNMPDKINLSVTGVEGTCRVVITPQQINPATRQVPPLSCQAEVQPGGVK